MRKLLSHFSTILIATFACASAVVISLAHHQLNFWGLTWYQQAAFALTGIPLAALPIYYFLKLIWDRVVKLPFHRWLVFLLPAALVAGVIAWRITLSPIVWHQIQIHPAEQTGMDDVRIIEIKTPQGNRIPFADIDHLGGWRIVEESLVADGTNPEPLIYSFRGPIHKPVRITFVTLPESPAISVSVDGFISNVEIAGSPGSIKEVKLPVRYKFGIPSGIMMAIVIGIDFIALLFLFTILWVALELAQGQQPSKRDQEPIQGLFIPDLLILVGIGSILHGLNLLAVPLVVVGDSTSFLDGALHWLKHFNLDGVSSSRGPGLSMLFIPVMGIFGRNPWGLKILLHILAIGCIPLCYQLGWLLTGKRWFAILAGSIAILTPDLYLYSNMVMSEIPNILFGLVFMVLLVLALDSFQWKWLLGSMVFGAFCVLIRPENLLMLAVGMLFLVVKGYQVSRNQITSPKPFVPLAVLGLSLFAGLLPLIWWSAHNYRQNGFFGLSDYAGEVLYDGWIYFGESSHLPITDPDSEAARIISSVYIHHPSTAADRYAPTGWDVLPALVDAGYSEQEAFGILGQTAIDSIANNPTLALDLLFIKIREGFVPETTATFTINRLGEISPADTLKTAYFDEERLIIPALITLQQFLYQVMDTWYIHGYQTWIWICMAALLLSLYRHPFFLWVPLGVLTGIRILFPTIMGISHWRYVLSGILPLQIITLAGLYALAIFILTVKSGRETSLRGASPE